MKRSRSAAPMNVILSAFLFSVSSRLFHVVPSFVFICIQNAVPSSMRSPVLSVPYLLVTFIRAGIWWGRKAVASSSSSNPSTSSMFFMMRSSRALLCCNFLTQVFGNVACRTISRKCLILLNYSFFCSSVHFTFFFK